MLPSLAIFEFSKGSIASHWGQLPHADLLRGDVMAAIKKVIETAVFNLTPEELALLIGAGMNVSLSIAVVPPEQEA